MIRVTKDFSNLPDNLVRGVGDYNHASVRAALDDIYNQKCCYCEQKIEDFEVEHYRPQRGSRSRIKEHHGYPWLRLEWSNLLWSCSTCNAGVGAKHTKFPITYAANRITAPSENPADNRADSAFLLAEGALLIHPEIENPEDYLTMLFDGRLSAIDNNSKGLATIDVCKLNRDHLQLEKRKATIDDYCRKMIDNVLHVGRVIVEHNIARTDRKPLLLMFLEPTFNDIKANCAAKAEFALLHRVFYQQFDTFVTQNVNVRQELSPSSIQALQNAFSSYKTEQEAP